MRRIAGLVLVCLAAAGCGGGGDEKKAAAAAARQLDPGSEVVAAIDVDYGGSNWQQAKRLYARAVQQGGLDFGDIVFGVIGDDFVVASSRKLAQEVARMPTDPAPRAGTRLRVDVPTLLDTSEMESEKELRALLEAVELSASAQHGDIVADAKVTWSR